MPPGLDVRAARPKVVLHFHLSDGGLRTGRGWCGQNTAARPPSMSSWSSWAVPDAR